MIELLIIADDVTGALDTGCQFGKLGIPTAVYPGGRVPWQRIHADLRVAVVNTDTRHRPAGEAYAAIHKLALESISHGVLQIFKKIDSALRGNVGSELQALLDCGISDRLYLLPAYPDNGRTTENGIQFLDGQEISCSGYGQDPFSPVRSSHIRDLFSSAAEVVPCQAPLPDSAGLWILDAVTNDHLRARCREFPAGPLLLAGCAGLAAALADRMEARLPPHQLPRPHKLLIVSGSLHPVSRKQVALARRAGIPCVGWSNAPDTVIPDLERAFRNSLAVILEAPGEPIPGCAPGIIADGIAQTVRQIYEQESPLTLAVFGGDTLLAIASRLLREDLHPTGELLPGVSISLARDHSGRSLCLISKSGGFGPEILVEHLIAYVFSENQGGTHYGTDHARHI